MSHSLTQTALQPLAKELLMLIWLQACRGSLCYRQLSQLASSLAASLMSECGLTAFVTYLTQDTVSLSLTLLSLLRALQIAVYLFCPLIEPLTSVLRDVNQWILVTAQNK
jgi:hypothetical protein